MRIAVFGAGGVGGYFGGRLAQAGEDVTFIARGEHLRAMIKTGLSVDSTKGDFHIHPLQATDNPRRVGEVDFILVAVKAWQVPDTAPEISPMIGEKTGVVPLCNGVDAPAQLTAALGSEHVLGGFYRVSSFIAKPGNIRHVGVEPYVGFGELDRRISRRAEQLLHAFERSGVTANIPGDILSAMWEKFIFIAAFSGVGAVTRASIGAIRKTPETYQMLEDAVGEIVRLAGARGVSLPDNIGSKTLAFIDNLPGDLTPSMQRDIVSGKPSELGSQNGAVVRMGLETGVPTPTHTFIYHSLLLQELIARGA